MILGLANGCFDGMHEGHRYFINECLLNCDKLIILVNGDWWVHLNKGKERPINKQRERLKAVRALLRPWDEAHLWDGSNLDSIIERNAPDKIFRGWDQQADVDGVPIVRVKRYGNYSTTKLASA